jgi:putative oxidoreductase
MPAAASVALLILRLVVGALFVGHGTQKLFGWFEGGGVDRTGQMRDRLGYRPGRRLAVLGGLVEAGGGVLVGFGFLTALGAALLIGMMVSAALSVHAPNGVWASNGGFELPLVNGAVATLLAIAGPGAYSVDGAIGWRPWGPITGVAAVLLALAVGVLVDGWRTNNLQEQRPAEDRHSTAA